MQLSVRHFVHVFLPHHTRGVKLPSLPRLAKSHFRWGVFAQIGLQENKISKVLIETLIGVCVAALFLWEARIQLSRFSTWNFVWFGRHCLGVSAWRWRCWQRVKTRWPKGFQFSALEIRIPPLWQNKRWFFLAWFAPATLCDCSRCRYRPTLIAGEHLKVGKAWASRKTSQFSSCVAILTIFDRCLLPVCKDHRTNSI